MKVLAETMAQGSESNSIVFPMRTMKNSWLRMGATLMLGACAMNAFAACNAKKKVATPLSWDASRGTRASLTLPTGTTVNYTA